MPMPMLTERKNIQRSLPVRLKDVDAKQGIVCAYASSFNIKDDNYPIPDVVRPSAFKKTLQESGPAGMNRILHLWDHNKDMILGKPHVLQEDQIGLEFESKIIRTGYGSDVLLLYEEQIINEHSIGYFVVKHSYGEFQGQKVRFLEEVALLEVSSVPWGMNAFTPTLGLKDNPDAIDRLAAQLQRVQALLHSGHFQSDSIAPLLQKHLAEWELLLKAVQPPAPAHDHIHTTQEDAPMDSKALEAMIDARVRQVLAEQKGASGSLNWPLADRTHPWDGAAAHKRMLAWAGGTDNWDKSKWQSVHMWTPPGDDANDQSKYKLLFCDLISDEVKAVPRAIFEKAELLDGGRAGLDIPEADKEGVKAKVTAYYHKMAKDFDDDSIKPPWEQDEKTRRGRMARKDYRYVLKHADYRSHLTAQLQQHKDYAGTLAGMKEDLQDEWASAFDALVATIIRDMRECCWAPSGEDAPDAHKMIAQDLEQFTETVLALVDKSVAADFVPIMDDDGDSFFDPDDDDDDDYGMMSARLAALRVKEGRVMSAANHQQMKSLHSDMGAAMKDMQTAHKAMGAMLDKMKPSAPKQDEGEEDTSDDAPDNDNPAKGAKGAKIGAGATQHTTGTSPAGAPEPTTPGTNDLAAAFNATLERMRSLTGVLDGNRNH